MFPVAIVLNKEDLEALVSDLVEVVKEEFAGEGSLTVEQLEEFLVISFEELLQEYEVDGAVVLLPDKWYEVRDGGSFVSVVKDFYKGLESFLTDAKGNKGNNVS